MNDISRRNLLLTSLSVAAGSLLLPAHASAQKQSNNYAGGLVTGLAKPLKYKSIPGFLSAEQLTPHHSAHYDGALRGYLAADSKLQSNIITSAKVDSNTYGAVQRARTNKANSVILHELYFEGMSSTASKPSEEILTAINKRFSSIEKWAADFQASGKAASGWAILALHPLNGKLYNVVSDKHATGVLSMAIPLVVIDVYEHAYYVDYKNKKALYIEKYMQHIDWQEVNRRFKYIS